MARRRGREGEEGEGLTAELDTDGEKEKESPMEIRRFLRGEEKAAASINCNAARRQFKRRLFCAASANLQGGITGISDHQNMNCLSLSSADIDN